MSGQVYTNPLFVGLTRPPMLFGASYMFVLMNAFVCMILYIATSEFKYMFMIFPIHMVAYYICSKEPLILELIQIRAAKCSRCRNWMFHGCNSYDPS